MKTDYITFGSVAMCCTAASGFSSLWMFWNLLQHREKLHRRLLWRQLLALCVTDVLWAAFGMPGKIPWLLSVSGCQWFDHVHKCLEYSACMIEIQIAAGLAAACFRSTRAASVLRRVLFLSWTISIGLFMLVSWGSEKQLLVDDKGQCATDLSTDLSTGQKGITGKLTGWQAVVLGSCLVTFSIYSCSIIKTVMTPGVVYNRAICRAVSYLMCFLGTFGILAISHIVCGDNHQRITGTCWCFMCLNGVSHVFCYSLQNPKARKTTRTELSFHVGFTNSAIRQEHEGAENECADVPNIFIQDDVFMSKQDLADHYFDFENELC